MGVTTLLKLHPGKVETEDPRNKLASKVSHVFKFWV